MSGAAEWEAEAAVADQADAAVEAFESSVVEAEPEGVEDPVAVADGARELDERVQAGSGCPGQPDVEVLVRERWIPRAGRGCEAPP